MNPGGGGCSELRSCHCTPAWVTEQDSVERKEKKRKEKKRKEKKGKTPNTKADIIYDSNYRKLKNREADSR